MSRKHYQELAKILGNGFAAMQTVRVPADGSNGDSTAYQLFYDNVYIPVTEMLAADNPRFDQTQFCFAVAAAMNSGKADS